MSPYDGRARLPLLRVNHEDAEPFFVGAARLGGFLLRHTTRQDWAAAALPPGPLIVCPNHIANFDPLAVSHFVLWSGRFPRFLAKVELFRIPVIGWLVRGCGQIPVARGTEQAVDALVAAREALAAGRCVIVYPEGTRTRDPELWPMAAHTGTARLALTTRAPVIPVANWGAQQVTPHRTSKWPRLFPRRVMRVAAGSPVPLADLYADDPSHVAVAAAGERIMAAITALLADLRHEAPPAGRWDPASGGRVPPVR